MYKEENESTDYNERATTSNKNSNNSSKLINYFHELLQSPFEVKLISWSKDFAKKSGSPKSPNKP